MTDPQVMRNEVVLTPFFLDAHEPALQRLAAPSWRLNKAEVLDAEQRERMCAIHAALATTVAEIVSTGARAVSIAGDCCATIPVLAGLQRAGVHPVLVWLDAHGDFNTSGTTLSGFIGGMPLAMITGRGDQTLVRASGLQTLPDTDVFLSDARDLDPAERELIDESQVTWVTNVTDLVAHVPERPIYVHLDVDVINPNEAPAMLYATPGGAGVDALCDVAERLCATGRLVAVSMTPWALDRDADGRTAEACWRVFRALLAE